MEQQSEPVKRNCLEAYVYGVARLAAWAFPIVASSLLVLLVHELGHSQQKQLDQGLSNGKN
jgi:hypothetical protein